METEILGYGALTAAIVAVAVEVVKQVHAEYKRAHTQRALQQEILDTTNKLLDQSRQLQQQARAHIAEAQAPQAQAQHSRHAYQEVAHPSTCQTSTKRFYDLEAGNYPLHQYNDALPEHPTRPFTEGDYGLSNPN